MAKLIIEDKEYDIADGEKIESIGEEHGVPFNCHSGLCGTCMIEIVDGSENLSPVNAEEDAMGMDQYNRLCCQTKILKGTVKISY